MMSYYRVRPQKKRILFACPPQLLQERVSRSGLFFFCFFSRFSHKISVSVDRENFFKTRSVSRGMVEDKQAIFFGFAFFFAYHRCASFFLPAIDRLSIAGRKKETQQRNKAPYNFTHFTRVAPLQIGSTPPFGEISLVIQDVAAQWICWNDCRG